MSALDGKITIGIDYRPCIVHIPAKVRLKKNTSTVPGEYIIESPEYEIKALFHCWSHRSELVAESPLRGGHQGGQVSGTFAIVEYEDGTVHEVEPQNIRFVDNAMCEYAFPDKSKDVEKQEDADWHCPNCKDGIMRIDDSMVLTSNPPQYQYKCDKCGRVEYSNRVNRTMTQTTLWSGKQHRTAETWEPDT